MPTSRTTCVILAGGQGKRMASTTTHKVCFPIVGVPAIVRAIDTYKQAGIRDFLVVVGQLAEQVIATVSATHPEVTFVYQAEARGTGHAALVAVEALAARGCPGPVLITMGDKVTRPAVVRALLKRYAESKPDILLTTLPKAQETSAGRVLQNGTGEALGIIEVPDIRRAQANGTPLRCGGQSFTAAQVEEHSPTVNASLYVFDFRRLHQALRHLSPSNAQGELYLTDTIEFVASHSGRVAIMAVPHAHDIMAFNTPAELFEIERIVRAREGLPVATVNGAAARLGPQLLRPAREWLAALEQPGPEFTQALHETYGPDAAASEERREAMLHVVRAFVGQFGPQRPMVLCRAPGRVNLMGRHVDHRGGYVNVMAINKEALLAAGPRDDDLVRLRHLDVNTFPNREFHIFDLLREQTWTDWMDFLGSHSAKDVLATAPGDWSHYVRAPLLRMQYQRRDLPLKGMDCMVSGNIPMGAGLSSSSALVVAFATTAVSLNGLDLTMREFIDYCGEGEWFVGSRGGSADHAAIRTSQLGRLARLGFFPFRTAGDVSFPADLRLVIAHSGATAVKSAGARDTFNHRVAAYEFAQMLLRQRWPAAAAAKHLRDLVPDQLGVHDADLFLALRHLPQDPTREQLRKLLPESDYPRMEQIFANHADLGPYDLRGVALFGLSECIRSERFAAVLEARDLDTVARFMRASHDGDRIVRHAPDGTPQPFQICLDDVALTQLADSGARLVDQCGRYACSTQAIDRLVDLANATPGVIGAQLAGAGLGGCMMILVRQEACDALVDRLRTSFYEPQGLAFAAIACQPVAGAGLVSVG
jgi:N-acetylgalactosamine kinase